jgi:ketosteroid isomerase-like protein
MSINEAALAELLDQHAVEQVLYTYGSRIDMRDHAAVRATFTDDIVAQYGNADPIHGADEVIGFIAEFTEEAVWEHHFLNVYHVDIDGDEAQALIYHTSHQMFSSAPGVVHKIVGRYHNTLRRTADGWKISNLLLEILWADRSSDSSDYLGDCGGTGPKRADDEHTATLPAAPAATA